MKTVLLWENNADSVPYAGLLKQQHWWYIRRTSKTAKRENVWLLHETNKGSYRIFQTRSHTLIRTMTDQLNVSVVWLVKSQVSVTSLTSVHILHPSSEETYSTQSFPVYRTSVHSNHSYSGDTVYLSASSHSPFTLCYTCPSIRLCVCMAARLLSMCVSSQICQSRLTEHSSGVLWELYIL